MQTTILHLLFSIRNSWIIVCSNKFMSIDGFSFLSPYNSCSCWCSEFHVCITAWVHIPLVRSPNTTCNVYGFSIHSWCFSSFFSSFFFSSYFSFSLLTYFPRSFSRKFIKFGCTSSDEQKNGPCSTRKWEDTVFWSGMEKEKPPGTRCVTEKIDNGTAIPLRLISQRYQLWVSYIIFAIIFRR